MRLRHPDGTVVSLAYCTNVHPAEDLDGVLTQLGRYAEPVRDVLAAPRLGLGLWLSAAVAQELAADPTALQRLRAELHERGLEVVTLNGFPYGGFHAERVKRQVYVPDWADPARLAYTLDLARVLAALLPEDCPQGSISTVPLGWRDPWPPERHDTARAQLRDLADGLAKVRADTGRSIRVGLEPEPGCVVETIADAARRLGDLPEAVGVCLDACHLAVGFEDPRAALDVLAAAGLDVVKMQASAALHAEAPGDPATRAALAAFAEERFLHQTRTRSTSAPSGAEGRDDLPDALDGPDPLPAEDAWRVHFHVPVHAEPAPPLRSTRTELAATLDALLGGSHPRTDTVEVETYTWGVLPEGQRPADDAGLVAGLAAEVAWVRDRLTAAGLVEETP